MRFSLLGPLMAHDTADSPFTGSTNVRTLLAVLLLRRGQVVTLNELKAVLWGNAQPATAASSLHNHITRLRRALGPEGGGRLRSVPTGYVLEVHQGELDSDQHEELLSTARAARISEDWETIRQACATALELWRGSPVADLPGLADSLCYGPRLKVFDEARLIALEWRCEAELHLGRHHGLAAELYALTEQHPLREGFHRHLMVALHRADRQAEALAVFHRLRSTLADELGVEPGRAVQDALAEILQSPGEPPKTTAALSRPEPAPEPRSAITVGGTPAAGVPAQLPPAPRYFSGRRAELARLDALLDDARRHAGTGPIVLSGPGGVGKTALAVHWAHRVRADFPDGQLHLDLRGFAPDGSAVTPHESLRGLLEGLGVQRARVPASQDARTALFRTLTDGRRLLVLLDNARDAEHVRPLIAGSATSLTVVTSRDQLLGLVAVEGAQPVPLDVLPPDEARELLIARIGHARAVTDPRAVDEAVELAARLPLALAVIGAQAAVTPASPLDQLVARLRRAHGLDAFTGSDARSDVRAVLSWSYETLDTDVARLFRLLAVHPGPGITTLAASSLCGVTLSRAEAMLAELARANLVTESADGRYAFHDLLRVYAEELGRQVDSTTTRRFALRRVTEHYLHTAQRAALLMDPQLRPLDLPLPGRGVRPEHLSDIKEARAWFTSEHTALLATVRRARAAGLDKTCWQLAYALKTFLCWGGHWEDWVAAQTVALEAAERTGDTTAQAQAHRSLAAALDWSVPGTDAQTHLRQALHLFTAEKDVLGQADVHLDLAGRYERQERPQDALHHNEQALALYRCVGDRGGEAKALNNVGYFKALFGEYEEALALCNAARQVFEELGDRRSLALTWDSLGVVHQQTGDLTRAAQCFRRAAEGCREVGSRYHEADSLDHLGDVELAAGHMRTARDAWQRAWDLLTELQHDEAAAVRLKLERSARPSSDTAFDASPAFGEPSAHLEALTPMDPRSRRQVPQCQGSF